MAAAHTVPEAAQLEAQHGHVEGRVRGARRAAQTQEVLAAEPQVFIEGGEVFLDEMKRKRIMAGRDRRVGGEHGGRLDGFDGVFDREAGVPVFP